MVKFIGIGMILLGVLLFLASLVLAFIWRLRELIDEFTGNKAKRQIKLLHDLNMRAQSYSGALDNTGSISNAVVSSYTEEDLALLEYMKNMEADEKTVKFEEKDLTEIDKELKRNKSEDELRNRRTRTRVHIIEEIGSIL